MNKFRSLVLPALLCLLLSTISMAHAETVGDPHNVDTHQIADQVTDAHEARLAAAESHGADVHESSSDEHHGSLKPLGERLPLWSIIPFLGILLSIALLPLFAAHFWHHHFGKISAFWALLFAIPFFLFEDKHTAIHSMLHIYALDYLPFIVLLAALFVIAGGIAFKGRLAGTPLVNTMILLVGTILSSWIGTTGSSMLLIRPLLKSNSHRENKAHVVIFFIFLVSNIGGSLTPIGDPPLFLGFLHGVDFFWTLALFPSMALNSILLLGVFFALDTFMAKREKSVPIVSTEPLRLEGAFNFVLLGGVVVAVILSGVYNSHPFFYDAAHQIPRGIQLMGGEHPLILPWINLLRDGFMILLLLASLKLTKKETRDVNEFNWFPIKEVAFLFAGIFMTIIPALEILKVGTSGSLGFIVEKVSSGASYFWVTGLLSSFLDNAPTYLTFFNTALGSLLPGISEAEAVPLLMTDHSSVLLAISCGAVFMGAMTYIGNAPNFMVKAIAEQSGVKMPSFFGYMAWSVVILIPIFLIDTLLFF